MNYKECLNYIYQKLPMYHHIGKQALRYDLTNTLNLSKVFNNPHLYYPVIHIAGTNGKGSVSHMLASVLQSHGYKTGLYTSPHLVDFRERIKINGNMVEHEFVQNFIQRYISLGEPCEPSFFELITMMAFEYFRQSHIDIAVIETGLGGRLDATNIVNPILSIITNISYDHTEILGDTLEKIAFEKAGIIKQGVDVIIGESRVETKTVFLTKAKELNANVFFADQIYRIIPVEHNIYKLKFEVYNKHQNNVNVFSGSTDMTGIYQLHNLITVYASCENLKLKKIITRNESISEGLSKVKANTGLLGRWQVIEKNPLVICDTAHNFSGITFVVEQLCQTKSKMKHIILSFVKDKDINKIMQLFAQVQNEYNFKFYFTRSSVMRSHSPSELAEIALKHGVLGQTFENVQEAFTLAKSIASQNDIIFIGGSNFLVGDFLNMIQP